MAEELLRKYGGDDFETASAGYEPTEINPYVVEAMKDEGIDLSEKKTHHIDDIARSQKYFGYVITVCSRSKERECPVFPGVQKNLHWEFEDPENFTGTHDEILEQVRALRDKIKEKILAFIEEYKD